MQYESGAREPTYPTLERIVGAAGSRTVLRVEPVAIDREVAAARLVQVLRFAEHFPRRPAARRLRYPRLP